MGMHLQIFNCNSKYGVYNSYYFSIKKKEKMWYMTFLPNAITVYSREKAEFDYKNNYRYGKLANFWLDTINKIKSKILIVMSYILSGLGLKKVEPVWSIFK